MKKRFSSLIVFILILNITPLTTWGQTKDVPVALPTFEVRLNGIQINNRDREYPFIVYKGITYFPMTYDDSRFLGLKTEWDQKGLSIEKSETSQGYTDTAGALNHKKYTASIPTFPVKVNGKFIDNNQEKYPLLIFRNVTYFPLTWRFAVDEFGWGYSFTNEDGLKINSSETAGKYNISAFKLPSAIDNEAAFTIAGDYYYYEGHEGKIYQASIKSPSKAKEVYQLPIWSYGDGNTYVGAGLENVRGSVILMYHQGGAVMGTNYMIQINEDGTNEEIDSGYFNLKEFENGVKVRVNQGVPPSQNNLYLREKGEEEFKSVGDPDYIYGWLWKRGKDGQGGFASTDLDMIGEDIYVLAYFKPEEVYGTTGVHRVNVRTGKTERLSDYSAQKFEIHGDTIYFVDLNNYLYRMNISDKYAERLVDSPISKFAVLGDQIYYVIVGSETELYQWGKNNSLIKGATISTIFSKDGLLICTFDKNINSKYGMIIFNEEGNTIFKTTKSIKRLKIDQGKVYYIED